MEAREPKQWAEILKILKDAREDLGKAIGAEKPIARGSHTGDSRKAPGIPRGLLLWLANPPYRHDPPKQQRHEADEQQQAGAYRAY